MADETPAAEKPEDEAEETSKPWEKIETNPLGQRVKYVSDEERRAAEISLSEEEAAKYNLTVESPSSGGVFPPSAVVTPFSPEEIAAHTPGDEGRAKLEEERAKAFETEAKEETPKEPAADTTPAETNAPPA
jgi:hypothetical protein